MEIGNLIAGLAGGSLTLAGQHLLGLTQHRRNERSALIAARGEVRERLVQQVHALGQITGGDYIEASVRAPIDVRPVPASSRVAARRRAAGAGTLLSFVR